MKKIIKCKQCGEEDSYLIKGSHLFAASIISSFFFFWVALLVGLLTGIYLAEQVNDTFWKNGISMFAIIALLWTIKWSVYLPDYEEEPNSID